MKMVEIKDIGVKYVLLSSGKYLVGEETMQVDGYYDKKVQIKEGIDVRKITETNVVVKYINGEGEMSFEDYEKQKGKLLTNGYYNDDDEWEWHSLESEFEYKKLTTYWKPVYRVVQEFSEPLKLAEIKEITYDTGNKYIKNIFFNGGSTEDITLYVYNRPEARIDIVNKIFKDLGFEYKDNISYLKTENEKIWGNATHSVIRYVQAFGKYIFNDTWDNKFTPRGTLEDLTKMYNDDYNDIKKIIMTNYNRTFGRVDEKSFDFVKLVEDLNSLKYTVDSIDSKVKTQEQQNKAIKKLNKMIEEINNKFK